ncbi:MAG: amino acid adenylation domain-containing protein, partial [Algicola sp.]|nr:amino acid adenylation domain-containing protein [Algicola sp.]
NAKANQLAHVIVSYDLKPNSLVALYLDRSPQMVVAMLAVLKVGAAYVPVSAEYPASRVQFILDDTQTPLVLTQQHYLANLDQWISEAGRPVVLLDLDSDLLYDSLYGNAETSNLELAVNAADLAYVIYTSGTTGQPKGVSISHQNTLHLVAAQMDCFATTDCQRTLMFAAYVFDACVFELYVSILNGSTVYLCTESQRRDPVLLGSLIRQAQIEMATLPPTVLSLMDEKACTSLKPLVTAGESPSLALLERFARHCRVFNAYGPSEVTVCASAHQYQPGDLATNIGKAIANTRLYVLDNANLLVPVGVAGELCIGGAGLSCGYLNRPELNAERFIANPFATSDDIAKGYTRLYKTGDLVKLSPQGDLIYLGRNDFQVKIRGLRVELDEIISVLTDLPGVKQAVVIDVERHGRKSLAAYIVSLPGQSPNSTGLREQLADSLPDYMVPSTFTFIDSVPLTVNGKLDRPALPQTAIPDNNYVAPQNALQTQLCVIWQDLLGLEQVGIEDNFFTIGGDSIVSIQLVSRLRKAGFTLQVKDIFATPTINKLAIQLNQSSTDVQVNAEQGLLDGAFDLLPIQQWFFAQSLPSAHHFNQAFMLVLPSTSNNSTISTQQLEQALAELVAQHDILRAHFEPSEGGWQQCYNASAEPLVLKSQDIGLLNEAELQSKLTQWQTDFDYTNGPLWQGAHLTGFSDGTQRLWLAFHHLIIDVVSWRIIGEDLKQLLTGKKLTEKTSSYRQWVKAVQQYGKKSGETHVQEVAYWQQVTAGQHDWSTLCALPSQPSTNETITLPADLTDALLRHANQGYHTQINDLLLSALAIALKATFGFADNHIIVEGHGREAIDASLDASLDTTQTVGWFTTLYPLALTADDDIEQTIIQTKESLAAIPNKGICYGALVQTGHLTGILPPISFNYL